MKNIKFIILMLFCCVLCSFYPVCASQNECFLTLCFKTVDSNGLERSVEDVNICTHQVTNDNDEPLNGFEKVYDSRWRENASMMLEIARKCSRVKMKPVQRVKSNSDGYATLTFAENGVYVVYEEKRGLFNKKNYSQMQPFLVKASEVNGATYYPKITILEYLTPNHNEDGFDNSEPEPNDDSKPPSRIHLTADESNILRDLGMFCIFVSLSIYLIHVNRSIEQE